MAYTRKNPYISLDEIREELKMKPDDITPGSSMEDDLLRAIDNASRWVDDYSRRDFFFHDHSITPMIFDNFGSGVYDREIFPRFIPIIVITKVVVNDVELVADTDFFVQQNSPNEQKIIRINANWFSRNVQTRQTAKVYGTFGYLQNSSYPVTITGDTEGQLAGFSLYGSVTGPVYWKLTGADEVATLQLFADAAHTTLIAEGKTATGGGNAINLWPMNGSGISGTGSVDYTDDSDDPANVFTPGSGVYDPTTVPLNVPGRIVLATRLVAAAISGRNKKELVDLQGSKTTITDSEIPKTVFQILGRRAPVLI